MHHEGNSRLKMLARDDQVEIVTVIMNHAHTGQPGDGKRYVADLLGAGEFRRKSGPASGLTNHCHSSRRVCSRSRRASRREKIPKP